MTSPGGPGDEAGGRAPVQGPRGDAHQQTRHKERLGLIARHLRGAETPNPFHAATSTTTSFPPAAVSPDGLDLEALCSPAEREIIRRTRAFATTHVAPVICGYWERAEFPFPLVQRFAELDIGGGTLPSAYGCQNMSIMACGVAVVELARVDGSMSTFYLVHSFLAALTIGMLGTEAQKREWLPQMGQIRKDWGMGADRALERFRCELAHDYCDKGAKWVAAAGQEAVDRERDIRRCGHRVGSEQRGRGD